MEEGKRRHPKQKITYGSKDAITGELSYLDYRVMLPERSIGEVSRWVAKHMENDQVLAPPDLVEKHRQAAAMLMQRYL